MLTIPIVDGQGKAAGDAQVDPEILGGEVRPQLLKQAIVMYQANARQNTSATKSRGMVEGSTRKIYRQKGTGNARMGARRTVIRKGGGVAFAKGKQNYRQALNKTMRRLARNNAILAKIKSNQVVIVDGLSFDTPSTKRFAAFLGAVDGSNGCVFAIDQSDDTLYRSGRNIPKTEIKPLGEVNAYEILRRRKLVLTKSAFDALVRDPVRLRSENGAAAE
jgi:large subunit ribosomal protein L4